MPISQGLKDAKRHADSVTYWSIETNSDEPDHTPASYRRQIGDVDFVRTVYGGTKTMRLAKDKYLPRHPKEADEEHDRRLARAVLFNAFARTVHGLVGMIFRKDPIVPDEMPANIFGHLDNLDQAGRSLTTLVRQSTVDAMIDGHQWWHIEHPQVPRLENREQERALDVRPYWISIRKADALNVQYDLVDGRPVVTLFAYREARTEPDGLFGEREVDCVRVLRPGSWAVWERDDNDRWALVDEGSSSLPYVPVVWLPTNESGTFESTPPLLDLAYENVDHWQIRSDHRHAAMFASAPMPVFTGTDAKGVTWGPNRALFLPEEGASAQLLESSGASLASTRQDLQDCESRMAALGLAMLVRETRAAETAQAKLLDKSESDSSLSVIARRVEDAVNEALAVHADYLGAELGEARVEINRDFHESLLDATMIGQLSALVASGQLSLETMWLALVAGEVLPEEFDAELEVERILGVQPWENASATERR